MGREALTSLYYYPDQVLLRERVVLLLYYHPYVMLLVERVAPPYLYCHPDAVDVVLLVVKVVLPFWNFLHGEMLLVGMVVLPVLNHLNKTIC